MRSSKTLRPALMALAAGLGMATAAARATRVENAIWVADMLYGTVGTPTSFRSPPAHSTDVIFSFAEGGLVGQRSVAEYAPGDPAYNGGRWHVYAVAYTDAGRAAFDADTDGNVDFELTNAEEVMEAAENGLLTITDAETYFECPLLPSKRLGK